ncbi:MAG: PilW family protein, partial [Pirellulales bacterium]
MNRRTPRSSHNQKPKAKSRPPALTPALSRREREKRKAFTLVEVLIAATLTLIVMGLVVQLFAMVGTASSNTRALLETSDAVRNA